MSARGSITLRSRLSPFPPFRTRAVGGEGGILFTSIIHLLLVESGARGKLCDVAPMKTEFNRDAFHRRVIVSPPGNLQPLFGLLSMNVSPHDPESGVAKVLGSFPS